MITEPILTSILPFTPKIIVPTITRLLNTVAKDAGINTAARMAHFLAQVGHESGSFRYTKEIASGVAYEGRKDLGNITPGDGKKYKGRGHIQVTGRANYRACSMALFGDDRLLKYPELLEGPEMALKSALWYWNGRKLSNFADLPDTWRSKSDRSPLQYITLRINGGFNGLAERTSIYNRAKKAIV